MILPIDTQLMSLVISVFAGLAVGLLFDLYRTINYYIRPPKAFLYFADLAFWIITGVIVFIMLLSADFAQLRIYTFAGMGIGIFVYFKIFSEYVLKFYRALIYIVTKTFRVAVIFITLPFKLIRNALWYPMDLIRRIFIKTGKSAAMKVSKVFKKINKKK
jgi:spore cortex biosynthesis protein YabQ